MTYDELMDSILTAREQMLKHSIEANSVTLNGRKYGKLIENLPPNIKPTVFGMAVKADYAMPDDYDFLVQYEPPKPITNADRITSNVESLAKFIVEIADCAECKEMHGFRMCDVAAHKACEDCWLGWLRQEVADG